MDDAQRLAGECLEQPRPTAIARLDGQTASPAGGRARRPRRGPGADRQMIRWALPPRDRPGSAGRPPREPLAALGHGDFERPTRRRPRSARPGSSPLRAQCPAGTDGPVEAAVRTGRHDEAPLTWPPCVRRPGPDLAPARDADQRVSSAGRPARRGRPAVRGGTRRARRRPRPFQRARVQLPTAASRRARATADARPSSALRSLPSKPLKPGPGRSGPVTAASDWLATARADGYGPSLTAQERQTPRSPRAA